MQVKLFPNFTSIPFDYLLISWVTNYLSNRGFLTCLFWIVSIDRELHSLKRLEMLEQSVKLSRLIIFYFISNFLIYAPILPNRDPKTSAFRSVSFLEQFFSSSTVLQTPTIAVFARNLSGADLNFAPFRWRICLAPSESLCLSAKQNFTFVTLSLIHIWRCRRRG